MVDDLAAEGRLQARPGVGGEMAAEGPQDELEGEQAIMPIARTSSVRKLPLRMTWL
jgi:hypothetical protein